MLASIPNIDEIEVLVIDDKSTKDLIAYERLKNKYKHSNVKFFKNDTSKKGAGVCRNIGLKYIKGNWVVFADSDDFFVDGFFEIIKDYLDTNYDVVFFRPISIDRGTGKVSDRHQKYESLILNYLRTKDKKSELQLRYEFVVPWSKLINVNFIKMNNITFDEVIASNDVMFSTKIGYYMKKFAVTDSVIYCVTKNQGSLTKTISEDVFESRLKVKIDYCKFLTERLPIEDLQNINLSGRTIIYYALIYKLGVKKTIEAYCRLRKNRVYIFEKKYLNPFFLVKRIINLYKTHIKNKYYYKRDNEGKS